MTPFWYIVIALLTFAIVVVALHINDHDVFDSEVIPLTILLLLLVSVAWPLFWGMAATYGVVIKLIQVLRLFADKYVKPYWEAVKNETH